MENEAKIEDEIKDDVVYETTPKLDDDGQPEVDAEGVEILEQVLDDDGNPIVKVKPLFLMTDDDDVIKDDKSEKVVNDKTIPMAAHIRERDKLKKQRSDLDIENERLRLENEQLKKSTQTSEPGSLKRPKEGDFETDEAYDDAMDKYEAARDARILNIATTKNTQQVDGEKTQNEIKQKMNKHYSRADELIKEHGITQDSYINADKNVRDTIETASPGYGTDNFNFLISNLGVNSDKVVFYLGNSESKLAEFKILLQADPGGHKASVFLGELHKEMSQNTNKRTSQARKPAKQIIHGKAPAPQGKAEKKKFDAAWAKGDTQGAYDIQKAAKANKIDVSAWR